MSVALVYRDFDQQALDFQYNNQAQVADPKRYIDWYRTASEAARARVAHIGDIAYGCLPDERLDIFQPTGVILASDRRPVVVFLHGGGLAQPRSRQQQLPGRDFRCARRALRFRRVFVHAGQQ